MFCGQARFNLSDLIGIDCKATVRILNDAWELNCLGLGSNIMFNSERVRLEAQWLDCACDECSLNLYLELFTKDSDVQVRFRVRGGFSVLIWVQEDYLSRSFVPYEALLADKLNCDGTGVLQWVIVIEKRLDLIVLFLIAVSDETNFLGLGRELQRRLGQSILDLWDRCRVVLARIFNSDGDSVWLERRFYIAVCIELLKSQVVNPWCDWTLWIYLDIKSGSTWGDRHPRKSRISTLAKIDRDIVQDR